MRDCREALLVVERGLACARGHHFDRAREGYVNLLQPNERRSREPGDAEEVVAARMNLAAAGVDAELVRHVARRVERAEAGSGAALLEIGCGIGTQLAVLERATSAECYGLDLSRPALRRAARRAPGVTFVLANADRGLPFLDGCLDLALSIKARAPAAELARTLRPGGGLILAVPAPDDLVELRRLGAGSDRAGDPARRVLEELGPDFELLERETVREHVRLEGAALLDLARTAYRGARRSERERLMGVEELDVTLAATVLVLRRARPAAARPAGDRLEPARRRQRSARTVRRRRSTGSSAG